MPFPEVEEFARKIVREIRDAAIQSADACLLPQAGHDIARRWKAAGIDAHGARILIPDVVDEAVFRLFLAIDNREIEFLYRTEAGRIVDLSEEGMGELAGWYVGSGGWRALYSQERYIDDFADLADFNFDDDASKPS